MKQTTRHDWSVSEIETLFALPFADLLFRAQTTHRSHFNANAIQASTLLSIKTGGCSEDCGYCSQSAHHETELERQTLLSRETVIEAARQAKETGASRFCMGAAWRALRDSDLETVKALISEVKALGLQTCVTLGMLSANQAHELKQAGLDYYNHNIDTSESYYPSVVSTHSFADRLQTLSHVQDAKISVCSGGIVGMGEQRSDRAAMLRTLANLPTHPQSVPINMLVAIPGTPMERAKPVDPIELVRTIAVARLLMPHSVVRLSAGREQMSDELQALCFLAGANSIFLGNRLLTTNNPQVDADRQLFARLGIELRDEHDLRER
ncbi:MAG: biotin synthase BioB [Deltaproteobacteria bacterium]|nr:biotin synthase BioB [Deltaproteobacteria bacterium]